MSSTKPSLFGIKYSNRDFSQKETWGKNCFNSSFPASLCSYLSEKGYENVYLKLDSNLKVLHSTISTESFYGIHPNSENLFFAFETPFTPYQKFLVGTLPRVDLVTQSKNEGISLKPIEIKLTALPDHTTCELSEELYGCEIVVRPDSIVYLACSIAENFKNDFTSLKNLIGVDFPSTFDWSEPAAIIPHIPNIIRVIDLIALSFLENQKPFLMQPIWKTEGKSPRLVENCLDIFIWSDLALTRLFMDSIKKEISINTIVRTIDRPTRTLIWLFKMLYDLSSDQLFNPKKIIDQLSYNTKNDKAFAVSGRYTHPYLKSEILRSPRIKKNDVKCIILGGGQNLLSPERRFDAIIFNSPDLFN
jgi:hypothetical protein